MAENQEQDEEQEPFEGEEALELAREGKDDWNAWAEENPGRTVDFSNDVDFTTKANEGISFEGFTFPGEVNFSWAKFGLIEFGGAVFKGKAKFFRTTFEEITIFNGAIFEKEVTFSEANFNRFVWFGDTTFEELSRFAGAYFGDTAGFSGAMFEGYADFGGATFSGPVDFNVRWFHIVPDFRRSDFQKHVSLHGIKVDFRSPTETADADKYRRLKELAVNARDHDREQEFFAYELMAKRGHETHGLALVPNYLYEWTSNFGRSLRRPCIWLLGVWFGFGVLYRGLAPKNMGDIWDGLSFSAAQLLPFLGASKGALADARKALFGVEALGVGVHALGIVEGGLGILFLFLIGLALRNRFRI